MYCVYLFLLILFWYPGWYLQKFNRWYNSIQFLIRPVQSLLCRFAPEDVRLSMSLTCNGFGFKQAGVMSSSSSAKGFWDALQMSSDPNLRIVMVYWRQLCDMMMMYHPPQHLNQYDDHWVTYRGKPRTLPALNTRGPQGRVPFGLFCIQ